MVLNINIAAFYLLKTNGNKLLFFPAAESILNPRVDATFLDCEQH